MVAHTALLLAGQGSTSAINTSLILSLSPIMIMFIALFLGHKIGATKAAGMALSLLGCLMVIGVIGENGFNYNSVNLYGDTMTFASAVCWSFYVVFSATRWLYRDDVVHACGSCSISIAAVFLAGENSYSSVWRKHSMAGHFICYSFPDSCRILFLV